MIWMILFSGLIAGAVGGGVYMWNNASEQGKSAARVAVEETKMFYRCVRYFLQGGKYSACPFFKEQLETRVQLFSLCLVFDLWNKDHYRNGTFQDDMKKNLRNVAIPGTGIPLSLFALHKSLALFFLFVLYPLCALAAAINLGRRDMSVVCKEYRLQLLKPTDWFAFWRLNCALASYHASTTNEEDYKLEDKLTFLQVAQEKGIAVSPFMDIPAIICKHRNEEGGLGYMCYSNAVSGGDWIIQEILENDKTISPLLPKKAPLSTFRVITISTHGENKVIPLSCVWRAGRSGAITDHSAILFDVDVQKGVFKKGVTNQHWYQLGLTKIFKTNWTTEHNFTKHPDTGKMITGEKVDAAAITAFAKKAHEVMMPRVPIIGWDVALTNKGMLLLECNLSCNFFSWHF
mmetsp:Transcript_12491/g.26780  ORF Transcript_12491/g.26780 Transcript_12491/m.26780 type:complete len:403 (+) Transcript_12491:267-1475(+)